MLTSQTKDTTTAMAMRKLQKRGLTLENILAMPQEELEKLIRQVGFWKVPCVNILSASLQLCVEWGSTNIGWHIVVGYVKIFCLHIKCEVKRNGDGALMT